MFKTCCSPSVDIDTQYDGVENSLQEPYRKAANHCPENARRDGFYCKGRVQKNIYWLHEKLKQTKKDEAPHSRYKILSIS